MYNLHLSAEQLEIRDTVRDFVTEQVKPVVLKADRLDICDRSLPMDVLAAASQMGIRTLALSEDLGGAGADQLTSCIVAEELAAGDADIAAVLTETSRLGHILFDKAMTDRQRERFLSAFADDDGFHLAFADRESDSDSRVGVHYHRPAAVDGDIGTIAVEARNGEWIVSGTKTCVANAPVAKLFAVSAQLPGTAGVGVLLVPAESPGLTVHANEGAWHHGVCGTLVLEECRVASDSLLVDDAYSLLTGIDRSGRGAPLAQALNLGIGRAAYDAARDYAAMRVQGGRPIVQHQAIGTKLAEIAVKLEVARATVWQAAWACDHPEACGDRSLPDMPLQLVAQIYTSEAMLKAVKDAAEVFGAMGVMRDMPLQKYVHDARVCLHTGEGNSDAKLRLAEALAGFQRPATARAVASDEIVAAAGE